MIQPSLARTILVSGATGRQGGAVARRLVADGWRVRALTRNPGAQGALALEAVGAEVVRGDLNDPTSLLSAAEGAYGVFSVQATWGGDARAEVHQGKNLAEAARQAAVRHFIYSSAGGAGRAVGVRPQEQKLEVEQYLRTLELPATVFRPVSFMENYLIEELHRGIAAGRLAEPMSADTQIQRIAVDDIAAFVAVALQRPEEFVGRTLEIAGDERTMAETAEAFGSALGRPVRYVRVPWAEFRERQGEERARMFEWLEAAGFEADIERCRRLHVGLRTLEDWIAERFPGDEAEPA